MKSPSADDLTPLDRAIETYAGQLRPLSLLSRADRLGRVVDHIAIGNTLLDAFAARVRPHFDDGSRFGITTYSRPGEGRDKLDEAVGRWFYARLNEQLRAGHSSQQWQGIASEFLAAANLFREQGFSLHAAEAFDSAAHAFDSCDLFEQAEEARYLCKFEELKGRVFIRQRLLGWFQYLTCGFGYRPYRLILVAVAVIFCSACLLSAFAGIGFIEALQFSADTYFNWTGPDEAKALGQAGLYVLYVVASVSIVLNSTLLALLARRWFKL